MVLWLKTLALVLFTAGLKFSPVVASDKAPFRDGIEYRYDWESTTFTSAAGELGLKSAMKGQVWINAKNDGPLTKTVFRLRNVTVSASSAAVGVNTPQQYTDPAGFSEDFSRPFHAVYNGSQVKTLGFDKKDPDWIRNIKRAVVSSFQLAVPDSDNLSYTSREDSLYGLCSVKYFAVPTSTGFVIEKERDLSNCDGYSTNFETPAKFDACSKTEQGPLQSSSVAEFTVNMNRGHPEIFSLRASGIIWLDPFSRADSSMANQANQSFILEKTRRASNAMMDYLFSQPVEMGHSLRFQVLFVPGVEPAAAHSRQLTLIHLIDLAESLEKNNVSSADLLSSVAAHVGKLDLIQLKSLHRELSVASGNLKLDTAMQLFLDAAMLSGTKSSFHLFHHLVSEKLLEEFTAARLIALYSVHVKDIDEETLQNFKDLAEIPIPNDKWRVYRNAAVLAVASIAKRVCSSTSGSLQCSSTFLERWTDFFYSKFIDSESLSDKALYLHALQNLGYGKLTSTLVDFALNYTNSDTLRIYAIQGMGSHVLQSTRVHDGLLRILKDDKNAYPVRIAAASVLSGPGMSANTLRTLARILWAETSSQVKSFLQSTIENVAGDRNPCDVHLQSVARDLLTRTPREPFSARHSTNYLFDFRDSQSAFGNSLNLQVTSALYDDLPGFVKGTVKYFFKGFAYEPFSFTVRISGLRKYLSKFLGEELRREELNLSRFATLLESLNLQPRKSPKFSLEVAFILHGRVVMYYLFDSDFLQNALKLFRNFDILSNYQANAQRTVLAGAASLVQPNEAGLPVLVSLDVPLMLSLKGAISRGKTSPRFGRLLDFNLFAFINADQTLTSHFAPLSTSQSVQINRRAFLNLPLNVEFSADVRKQQLDLEYTTPTATKPLELLTTPRTVRVKSSGSVDSQWQILGKEKPGHSETLLNLTWPVIGLGAEAEAFDCDKPVSSGTHIASLASAVNPLTMNTRGSRAAWAYLSFIRLQHGVFLQPYSHSCGYRARIHHTLTNPVTQIVGRLRFKANPAEDELAAWESGKYAVKAEVSFKGTSPNLDRKAEADITYEYSGAGAKNLFNIRVKVERTSALKIPDFLVCLKAEANYPPSPKDVIDIRTAKELPTAEGGIDFVMGEIQTGQTQCPVDQFRLKMNVKAQGGEWNLGKKLEAKQWPYDACQVQQSSNNWGSSIVPQTEACYRSALDYSTLRRYTFDFKSAEVPESISSTLQKAQNVLSAALLPYWTTVPAGMDRSDKKFDIGHVVLNATIYGDDSQIVDLSITESNRVHKFDKVPVPEQVTIPLPSTRLSSSMRLSYENSVIPSCTVTSQEILTLDNVTAVSNLTPCYTLLSSDCGETSHFAVLARKTTGRFPLAVKVHVGGHYIEIVPDESGRRSDFSIRSNDIEVDATSGPYFIPEGRKKNYILRLQQNGPLYIISSPGAGLLVHFSGHHIAVFPEWYHRNQHCGICGDFNGEMHGEWVGPEGCLFDNAADLTLAYSLGETCFAAKGRPQCTRQSSAQDTARD